MTSINKGHVSVVTGGASGIGRAVATEVARRGGDVVIFDIDEEGAHRVVNDIERAGHTARAMTVDVRDRSKVTRAVNEVHAMHDHLDSIFNIAGESVMGEVLDYDWEAWQLIIDTNLMGVVNCVSAAYPLMVKQRRGHIVNMGSMASLIPTPYVTSYTASKCGVWGLSLALRAEAADYGVKVCCVCPAAVETPMIDRARYLNLDKERAFKAVPGNRITAEACAEAILKGMEKDRAVITPSVAKWIALANRVSPSLSARMMAEVTAKLRAIRADLLSRGGNFARKEQDEKHEG
jgi:short-subunit dehydrogenase